MGFDVLALIGAESQVLFTVAQKTFHQPPILIALDDLHRGQLNLVGDQILVGVFGLFVSGGEHFLEGLGFGIVFDAHQGQDEGNLLDKDRPSACPTTDLGIAMVVATVGIASGPLGRTPLFPEGMFALQFLGAGCFIGGKGDLPKGTVGFERTDKGEAPAMKGDQILGTGIPTVKGQIVEAKPPPKHLPHQDAGQLILGAEPMARLFQVDTASLVPQREGHGDLIQPLVQHTTTTRKQRIVRSSTWS